MLHLPPLALPLLNYYSVSSRFFNNFKTVFDIIGPPFGQGCRLCEWLGELGPGPPFTPVCRLCEWLGALGPEIILYLRSVVFHIGKRKIFSRVFIHCLH